MTLRKRRMSRRYFALKTAEEQQADRAADRRVTEIRMADRRVTETRAADRRVTDIRATDRRVTETRAADRRVIDIRAADHRTDREDPLQFQKLLLWKIVQLQKSPE